MMQTCSNYYNLQFGQGKIQIHGKNYTENFEEMNEEELDGRDSIISPFEDLQMIATNLRRWVIDKLGASVTFCAQKEGWCWVYVGLSADTIPYTTQSCITISASSCPCMITWVAQSTLIQSPSSPPSAKVSCLRVAWGSIGVI